MNMHVVLLSPEDHFQRKMQKISFGQHSPDPLAGKKGATFERKGGRNGMERGGAGGPFLKS